MEEEEELVRGCTERERDGGGEGGIERESCLAWNE